MIEVDPEIIIFVGLFCGVLGRTLLPYLWALKRAIDAGAELPWSWKYFFTGLVSFLISATFAAIATVLMFPTALSTIINQLPNVGGPLIFASAFGWGWMANDVVNELMKPAQTAPQPPVTPPTG